jgi:hypothetical protein
MLDEPFGALDAFTREDLWCVIRDLHASRKVTVILVTHDLREAVFLADRIFCMSARPGRMVVDMTGGTEGPTSPAEVAAAHAATVGAAGALPDRVMSSLWPHVFTGLAEAGLASSRFDLVHLSHEILAQVADADVAPGADRPSLARADGGLVITVDSRGGSATVSDRFFVRRAVIDTSLPVATARAERAGVVATPLRTLGTLTVTAPSQPRKKASGIEMRPGLSSGNQEKSTPWIIDALLPVTSSTGLPETTGEKMISPTEAMSPP